MAGEKSGIQYQCFRCGKKVYYEELTAMPELKCPECGYKILKKVRPPIVKHVKAR
ncbi:DNA-directed RNA polymerase subunit P [Candidatus Hecatella orcuttiae]|jgi:DNA-directed RNA polymerase subunit P|uniref:DNA-directed RNA polymerase subunit P n=1 Tax=Candidatus Hecatella orcuttiae TaxID=1935119 RepID=UPI002867C91E|nr:DNA-directed RNA polymerase subunit P [Candidatus Hecatella orcuttiae]